MGQELLNLGYAEVARMPPMVERHVAPDPVELLLLRAVSQVPGPPLLPRRPEKSPLRINAFKLPCRSARLSPGDVE